MTADRADIVVIGGGIMGTSVALHLAEARVGSVRLIERDEIAGGTTAAGAGFVAPWADGFISALGEEEAAAEQYALVFYAQMHADGFDIDYANNGVLWVAPDENSWKTLQPLATFEGGARRELVSADRVDELTEHVVPAPGVHAGVYLPDAAQVSAAKAAAGIAAKFERRGGRIDLRRPALGLRVTGDRITAVETTSGAIGCDAVVLAAGVWNRELLGPLGVFLPTVPLVTSRIITEAIGIPGTMPAMFLYGLSAIGSLWVRGHHGALLWGGHYRTNPERALVDTTTPERFDHLPLDGVVEAQRSGADAARFMPVLGRYRSLTVAHGAPCFTADLRPLVGPVPGIDGLYVLAGDNEAGVTHAPGCGKVLAEHITGSDEPPAVGAWRVNRFGSQFANEAEITVEFGSMESE